MEKVLVGVVILSKSSSPRKERLMEKVLVGVVILSKCTARSVCSGYLMRYDELKRVNMNRMGFSPMVNKETTGGQKEYF
ncbi:hypothetical protein B9Z55_001960 [Caenorhabditis nigoni]|uniref:Uncharacterized protein n=1 Tax=Caenorhabditis nigoni TaxID=1611254 RepID=A0A2G5VIE9_9PELO|nr:hypothetical protein B9Z55_001960 [Caenorhabditis nigoni]